MRGGKRPGAGAPKGSQNRMKGCVPRRSKSWRIDPDLIEWIRKMAELNGCSEADIVNLAIRHYQGAAK